MTPAYWGNISKERERNPTFRERESHFASKHAAKIYKIPFMEHTHSYWFGSVVGSRAWIESINEQDMVSGANSRFSRKRAFSPPFFTSVLLKVLKDSSYLIATRSAFDAAHEAPPHCVSRTAHQRERNWRKIYNKIVVVLYFPNMSRICLPSPRFGGCFFIVCFVCVCIIYSKWNRKQNKSFVALGMAKQWIYLYH